MLLGLSQSEIEDWKASLHTYEKVKRTKRPFGKQQPEVKVHTKMEVIDKEMRFNPVLQSFRDEREQSRTIEHE